MHLMPYEGEQRKNIRVNWIIFILVLWLNFVCSMFRLTKLSLGFFYTFDLLKLFGAAHNFKGFFLLSLKSQKCLDNDAENMGTLPRT